MIAHSTETGEELKHITNIDAAKDVHIYNHNDIDLAICVTKCQAAMTSVFMICVTICIVFYVLS